MRQTRIYLPLSRGSLSLLAQARALDPAPTTAFAVTRQLERAHPGLDEEDLEFHAMGEAAEAADALRERPEDRRVLAAADVEQDWVLGSRSGSPTLAQVSLAEAVPMRRIVSFHVDPEDPVERSGGASGLLWYDVSELADVVEMFS